MKNPRWRKSVEHRDEMGAGFSTLCVATEQHRDRAGGNSHCPTWTGVSPDLSEWQLPFITPGFGRFPSSWRERDLSGVMSQIAVSGYLSDKPTTGQLTLFTLL